MTGSCTHHTYSITVVHCIQNRSHVIDFLQLPLLQQICNMMFHSKAKYCASVAVQPPSTNRLDQPVTLTGRWRCWRLSDSQRCVLIRNKRCSSPQLSRPGNLRPLAEWLRLSCCSCRSAGIRCCLPRRPPLQVKTQPTVRRWTQTVKAARCGYTFKSTSNRKKIFTIKGSDLQSGQEGCERSWSWPFRGHSSQHVPSLSSPLSGSPSSPWSDHSVCTWVKY